MRSGYKNFFFNNFTNSREQDLLDSLTIESIGIAGEDMFYIPRTINNYDPLYTADDSSSYDSAFPMVIYIESFDGFEGDQSVMSKFGVEIRDSIIFSFSQTVFNEDIGTNTGQVRPNEGDLIYFPLNNKVFQIKFVDKFQMFYQLGKLYTWKVTCELFDYSGEKFNTGIPQIDAIQITYDSNVLDYCLQDENGNHIQSEDYSYITIDKFDSSTSEINNAQINQFVANTSQKFIPFDSSDPFKEAF